MPFSASIDLQAVVSGESPLELIAQAIEEQSTFAEKLLCVPFTTVEDYLNGLDSIACLAAEVSQQGLRGTIFYLPAAVSDFYIPRADLSEHKIQSRGRDTLQLELVPVPKKLGMIKEKHPDAFVVSYKLETDAEILESKATMSMATYGLDMVIANLLQTYKKECIIFRKSDENQQLIK